MFDCLPRAPRLERPIINLAAQLRCDLRRDRELARTAEIAGDSIAARRMVEQRIAQTTAALEQLGEAAP